MQQTISSIRLTCAVSINKRNKYSEGARMGINYNFRKSGVGEKL